MGHFARMPNKGGSEEGFDSIEFLGKIVKFRIRGGFRKVRIAVCTPPVRRLEITGGRSLIFFHREKSKKVSDLSRGRTSGIAWQERYCWPTY
jgi:hypothetical protein